MWVHGPRKKFFHTHTHQSCGWQWHQCNTQRWFSVMRIRTISKCCIILNYCQFCHNTVSRSYHSSNDFRGQRVAIYKLFTRQLINQETTLLYWIFSWDRVLWGGMLSGNGIGNLSSNPGQGCLHFTSHQCFWETHQSISSFLPTASYV